LSYEPLSPDRPFRASLALLAVVDEQIGREIMVLVSVMYPGGSGSSFNQDYYLQKHVPLVKERWASMGLEDVRIVRGVGTPDGSSPPYQIIGLLTFRSMEDFQNAAAAHVQEIMGDIPNFTNVQPVIQISESLI